MFDLKEEINRRRTFAIISHPDAGKTTLTEKFLLYGGVIQLAGTVKGKKHTKHVMSDWMEIEKQRGISVTSSVMQFEYNGKCINILDTPGHEDFSEDTYRTLMAADSAVMVIDASKGVEKQTKKLFKVCVMRNIPIFTFINKMDREAKDPYDLIDEIEKVLGISTYPVNWPIGCGKEFKGVYKRGSNKILAFSKSNNLQTDVEYKEIDVNDNEIDDILGPVLKNKLEEDVELIDGAGSDFDLNKIQSGKLSPVFFGSALNSFGVKMFLENFLKLAGPPLARKTKAGIVKPTDEKFSAFVFKIQANMNKAHRDRIAFIRVCSGKFKRGMDVLHVKRGKKIKLAQSQHIMARERETIDEAYAGDIIGVFDPGIFSIGDTICDPSMKVEFDGIPTFAPENFARVSQKDTLKRKQFVKGINQIAQEGAIQIFKQPRAGMEELIVGVVGVLQFEVLEHRLNNEYNVEIIIDHLPFEKIRWIKKMPDLIKDLNLTSDTKIVTDLKGNMSLLFTNDWGINWAIDHNEGLKLSEFIN